MFWIFAVRMFTISQKLVNIHDQEDSQRHLNKLKRINYIMVLLILVDQLCIGLGYQFNTSFSDKFKVSHIAEYFGLLL